MSVISKISFITTLGLLSYSSCGFAVTSPDITGKHECKYHDPTFDPSDGAETISFEKNGDTYKVKQMTPDSVLPYAVGVGFFNKDVKNAFSYVYWRPKSPDKLNVQFFMVKSDGSLEGSFAQSNTTKAGTETCTPAK